MRFRIEQRFNAPVEELLEALVDPDYLATMGRLPGVGSPEVISRVETRGSVNYEMRYSFTGSLPSVVTRVIDPKKLTWVERTTVELRAATATFAMVPDHYESFFRCTGGWELSSDANDDAVTVRRIDGQLKVNSPVPLVGGQVERAIVSGLKERLGKEPAGFDRWRSR
jgi:hypothetical protein